MTFFGTGAEDQDHLLHPLVLEPRACSEEMPHSLPRGKTSDVANDTVRWPDSQRPSRFELVHGSKDFRVCAIGNCPNPIVPDAKIRNYRPTHPLTNRDDRSRLPEQSAAEPNAN